MTWNKIVMLFNLIQNVPNNQKQANPFDISYLCLLFKSKVKSY